MASLTTLTNSEIFGFAHSTAKKVTAKLGGHYSANFAIALKCLYADIKVAKAQAAAIKSSAVQGLASDVLLHPKRYTQWERNFALSAAEQALYRPLSAKQQTVVDKLVAKMH